MRVDAGVSFGDDQEVPEFDSEHCCTLACLVAWWQERDIAKVLTVFETASSMHIPECPRETTMAKTMTLRLDDERAATLELVARADNQSVSDAVRSAIDAHIEERRRDQAFIERLRQRHQEESALYERLAK
jgi:predicted transcriptional regulator